MTMLDRMRRHRNWLKWSLALVCLAFVFFYIPDFLADPGAGAAPGRVIAEVDGREVTVGQFQRIYRAQLQLYQAQLGGSANAQLLRQLGLDRQILQQLVDEQAALVEAERLGLDVTDAEVRERIVTMPAFLENGRFIGEQRYRQMLRLQRPPLTPDEFESNMRQVIVVEKLRQAVTGWITVADTEIDREYRRRNDKVKLDVVSFGLARLEPDIQAADAELQAHFDRNRESYRAPDQRKVKYLLIDAQAQRAGIAIPPRDVERAYNDRIDQYSTPEQVRASHILVKTEGKDEASVRARAEAVLAKARAGADFAQLAREYSEDESNAKLGGDLDYFARGRMVPEFDQAVFAMQPGSTSDLVRTQYGFHIIRLVDKRPASTKPLDAVRAQITEQLLGERAAARASEVAATLATQIDAADDLERVARERGLKVQESGFFAKGDPVLGLGFSPQISTLAFDLEEGAVSPMVPVGQGFAFLAVSATRASYLPKLDEVKDKVRQDVQKLKAGAAARAQAAKALAALRASSDFQKAAKAAGIEVKTTELITRGGAIPDVGVSAAIDAAAFSLPVGSVSDPIETNDHIVIIRVAERQEAAAAEVEKGRESLRQELAAQERSRFFDAYMEKAKARLNIRTYPDVLERAVS